MLGDGDDIGAGDFGDGDTSVGGVGGVQIDVVASDTSCDGEFKLFGFCEPFGGQVAWVESGDVSLGVGLLARRGRRGGGTVW